MKKVLSVILVVAVMLTVGVAVFAEGGTVTELTVENSTVSEVAFAGKTTALAVMADIYDENGLIAEKSFPVTDNEFSGVISDLQLTEGNTYTLKVADYDGGNWKVVKFIAAADETELPFTDVTDKDAYYYDAVVWGTESEIIKGTTVTTFAPNLIGTRAQTVTFLWRAVGCPEPENAAPFTDVKAGSYYAKAVAWAWEQEIVYGVTKNTFAPEKAVTRGQVVTFLYRLDGCQKADIENPFTDVVKGAYYYDAVLWAVSENIAYGVSVKSFAPNQDCFRCQIVTFLYRYFGNQSE